MSDHAASQNGESVTSASCSPHSPGYSTSGVEGGALIPLSIDDLFSLNEIGGVGIEPISFWENTGFGVSPDGRMIAFQMRCQDVEQNTYSVGWYTLDLEAPNVAPTFIGGGGEASMYWGRQGYERSGYWSVSDPKWSPTGDWVAFLRSDGGTVDVWRSRPDGSYVEQVTRSGADIEAFYWSDDGNQIWYETDATRRDRKAFIDTQWRGGAWADHPEMRPSSGTIREMPYQANGGRPSLWIKDLEDGVERLANEHEAQAHFSQHSANVRQNFADVDRVTSNPERPGSYGYIQSPDAGYAAWIESERRGFGGDLFVQSLRNSSTPVVCHHEECEDFFASRVFWSSKASEVIFVRREGSVVRRNVIYAWNVSDDSIRKVYEEGGDFSLVGCQSTGRSLVCYANHPDRPLTFVEIDLETGVLAEVFDPNPWVESMQLGDVERIGWENEYGIAAHGWLVKPVNFQSGRSYPLVIVQYNATLCFSGGTGSEHPAQLYAAHEIMVLCMAQPAGRPPNDSGEGGDNYETRESVLSSWESIIQVLSERGMVDPDRVGITGFSMGADNLQYGLHRTNAFSAAIFAALSWAPTGYYLAGGAPWGREGFRRRGLSGLGGSAYDNMSLGVNAERVNAPILVQTSDAERLNTTVEYVMLQDGGVPIDMYVFRNEYHTKWWPQNRYGAIQRSLAWMRFWLQGEVDPDTMSEQQFERWQRLCEQQIARLSASDDPVLQERATNQPCSSVSSGLQ